MSSINMMNNAIEILKKNGYTDIKKSCKHYLCKYNFIVSMPSNRYGISAVDCWIMDFDDWKFNPVFHTYILDQNGHFVPNRDLGYEDANLSKTTNDLVNNLNHLRSMF